MERLMDVGAEIAGPGRSITWDKMVEFESVVWDRGPTAHNSRETAAKGGMDRAFASGQNVLAFFHELFEREFGAGWIEGGTISVRWTRVVYEGDTIVVHARVEAVEDEGGRRRVRLAIWAENQNGEQTAAGTATAFLQ
jgi:acyl dehydratase